MSWEYRPAVREKIGALFGIAGPSGSGKTRTALHLAKGMANGSGQVAVIDTEAGRALHYAPRPGEKADSSRGTFDFFHVNFPPPFTPERYIEAVQFAESQGATVTVLDSTSHEWAGEGGCADIQAIEAERMARAAAEKSGRNWETMIEAMTAPSWKKPKIRHKRMVMRLLQSRAHLIFCLRAEEKIKIVDRKVVPIGFQPICEKGFMFEMTGSLMLHPSAPGCPDYGLPHKLNDDLQLIFPNGQIIGDAAGKRLREWAETGADRRAPDKIANGVTDLIRRIEDAQMLATLNEIAADSNVVKQRIWLRANRPELADRVDAAMTEALQVFDVMPGDADAPY
jgi:energy-coupling factor transporter ATP-binding protein EcfA2